MVLGSGSRILSRGSLRKMFPRIFRVISKSRGKNDSEYSPRIAKSSAFASPRVLVGTSRWGKGGEAWYFNKERGTRGLNGLIALGGLSLRPEGRPNSREYFLAGKKVLVLR